MRRILTLSLLALIGCGGSPKKAREARPQEESPGTQCIDEAATPRTPPTDAPNRADFAQILVRHAGVRSAQGVTRTREEACLRALDARKKLLGGSDWDDVFRQYSDSQGATQGVLYDVTQGSLDPAFAGAAFSLAVDELSYVVETPRGFHIIWRKK
jgi:NIMA-interacting peptidyl-prolyl cis-trans isomerase 1